MDDLDIPYPILLAEPTGHGQWRAWCPFCQHYHFHGVMEGHREAHCHGNLASPFRETGYYVMLASEYNRRYNGGEDG